MRTEEVFEWAKNQIGYQNGLSNEDIIILDEHTMQDDTCLLVASKENLVVDEVLEGDEKWTMVRSDFGSSIISLMTIETSCGGVELLETAEDGVVRNQKLTDSG